MSNWTWWQDVTFLLTLAITSVCVIASLPGWLLGTFTLGEALILPWVGLSVTILWVSTVGQTVTP